MVNLNLSSNQIKKIQGKKTKILFVIESFGGGSAKHVVSLCMGIDRSRYSITLVYSDLRKDTLNDSEIYKLENAGVKTVLIRMKRGLSLWTDLVATLKIYKLNKKCNFDIIHCHSTKAGFIGRFAGNLSAKRTPVIYTPHQMAFRINSLVKYVEKFMSNFCYRIIAGCMAEENEMINNGVCRQKQIVVIHNGIDLTESTQIEDKYLIGKRWNIPLNKLIVGCVSRMWDQKNPYLFFDTAKVLLNENLKLFFVWVGDGPLKEKIEQHIGQLGIRKNVLLTGQLHYVYDLLNLFDIFVLPSNYESFGYVTCEAMAMAKPTVVTDTKGSLEIVVDGETGLIVPKKDLFEMASAIKLLTYDKKLRDRMGKAGKERIEKMFTIKKMIQKTEELYETALCR